MKRRFCDHVAERKQTAPTKKNKTNKAKATRKQKTQIGEEGSKWKQQRKRQQRHGERNGRIRAETGVAARWEIRRRRRDAVERLDN